MGGCVSECAHKAGLSEAHEEKGHEIGMATAVGQGQFESAGIDDVKSTHDEAFPQAAKVVAPIKESKHVSFVEGPESEEVVPTRGSHSLLRKGTGFDLIGGASDGFPKVSFQEPEQDPGEEAGEVQQSEQRPSVLRQGTGFVFAERQKAEEEDQPKVSFAGDGEEGASERRSSLTRKGTGFVASKPDGETLNPVTPARKGVGTRKGTGYVRDSDCPPEAGDDSETD